MIPGLAPFSKASSRGASPKAASMERARASEFASEQDRGFAFFGDELFHQCQKRIAPAEDGANLGVEKHSAESHLQNVRLEGTEALHQTLVEDRGTWSGLWLSSFVLEEGLRMVDEEDVPVGVDQETLSLLAQLLMRLSKIFMRDRSAPRRLRREPRPGLPGTAAALHPELKRALTP
jgi:hypothetical protein